MSGFAKKGSSMAGNLVAAPKTYSTIAAQNRRFRIHIRIFHTRAPLQPASKFRAAAPRGRAARWHPYGTFTHTVHSPTFTADRPLASNPPCKRRSLLTPTVPTDSR